MSPAAGCGDGDADSAELARQERLVDQLATMQADLRDRYQAQATALRLFQLVASVIATAFAFASSEATVTIGPITTGRTTVLGWLAVLILTATVVDLVLNRGGVASRHGAAVRQLATLKTGYRVQPEPNELHATRERMTSLYETTMDSIPPVPERHFNRLKARHLLKVEVSRYLSSHPGLTARQARRAVRRSAIERDS